MDIRTHVNTIAITALFSYKDDIDHHPDYGWRIFNYAGQGDANLNRKDIYVGGYAGYSFADAVMIAAQNKAHQPNNDIWVEPDFSYSRGREEDLCVWILNNNRAKKDYTTLENMAAGRQNLPNDGGISDRRYDREYEEWVELTL